MPKIYWIPVSAGMTDGSELLILSHRKNISNTTIVTNE
jgi:hypothetical protein